MGKDYEQEVKDLLVAIEPWGYAYFSTPEFKNFHSACKLPKHYKADFNEKYFIFLISRSFSLIKNEKVRIIKRFPALSQFQIDELIKILEEEKQKFGELEAKHPAQVEKLREKVEQDWFEIELNQIAETVSKGVKEL